ncbi:hypothetical protein B0T25DRAFT_289258 [Lasiosphaeria hispida]|uniref:Uncharacterized protein n=1 Tax=Lasiosphaeria hispida TaxID=260671 RepID=A0AAJ0MB28_9PEZI|nr:hypothetical protein B0T25DRAFT_289258 [Lasiosphaeria hispida]
MDPVGPPPNRPLPPIPPIPPRRARRAGTSASQEREDLPATPAGGQQNAYWASLERSPPVQLGLDFSAPRNRTAGGEEAESPRTPSRPAAAAATMPVWEPAWSVGERPKTPDTIPPPRWENPRPAPGTPGQPPSTPGGLGGFDRRGGQSSSLTPAVPSIPRRFGGLAIPPPPPPPIALAPWMQPRPYDGPPTVPQGVAQQQTNISVRQGRIAQDVSAHPAISSSASTTIPGPTTANILPTRPVTPAGRGAAAASAEATNQEGVSR